MHFQVLGVPDVRQQRTWFQQSMVRQLLVMRPLSLALTLRRLRGRLRRRRTHHTMHHLVIITIIKLPLRYMKFSVCFWKSQPSFQSFTSKGAVLLVRTQYRSSRGSNPTLRSLFCFFPLQIELVNLIQLEG